MNKLILLGTAAGLFFAGPVSALTMTPTADNRSTSASAMAGFDSNSDSDAPGAGFPTFDSQVSANASDFPALTASLGDASGEFQSAWASASAGQFSQLGALSISGSGHAEASGSHGEFFLATANLVGDAITQEADFQAHGRSLLSILFSTDESAIFNISGFLSAGNELAIGDIGNDIINRASIILINTDTNTSAYKTKVSNDSQAVNESGVIGPGNYEFSVEAYAEVFGGFINGSVGDAEALPHNGYATGASFKGVTLELAPTDKPIPEPVTTSLIGMSLGALILRTSRRRHA